MERCIEGYYQEPAPDEKAEIKKKEEKQETTKIGIAGACGRIGTTTFCLQLVKYLQIKGHKACYLEVNSTEFVTNHEKIFNVSHDSYLGKVTFEGIDMFYKQENLSEVLKQDYEFFIYDFGTYMDTDFNKTSFLEKDLRIFVVGSKAAEMPFTNEIIRNEFYTDVLYVFNFISEKEKTELLEYMEEKANRTYFTVYSPDQFEYVSNPAFEKILPVQDICEKDGKKKKGVHWWKKGR